MKEIEKEACEVYSRAIFFRVRDEIMKEGKYIVTANAPGIDDIFYELTKYGQHECKRKVRYIKEKDYYDCGCNYFPTFGIPCRHVFATLKYRQATCIPQSMIVSQWTMNAKKILLKESAYAPRCSYTCSEKAARFGLVQTRSRDIAFVAGKSGRLMDIALGQMSKVHNLLLHELDKNVHTLNDKSKSKNKGVYIRNPSHSKTKGTSSSKRGPSGGKRRCSQCNKYGHNKTTCKNKTINNNDKFDETMEVNDAFTNIADDTDPWCKAEEAFHCSVTTERPSPYTIGLPLVRDLKTSDCTPSSQKDNKHSLLFNAPVNDDEYEKWWGSPL